MTGRLIIKILRESLKSLENSFFYGNTTQQSQLFLPEPNLIGEVANHWSRVLSTNANVQYSTVYQNLTAYSAQMMYNPEQYKVNVNNFINLVVSEKYKDFPMEGIIDDTIAGVLVNNDLKILV